MAGRRIVAGERIVQVLKLTNRGFTQSEIARQIGVTKQRVNAILKAHVQRTAKEISEQRELLIAKEISKIDEVIKEAYGEWERSKLDAEKESEELGQNEKGDTYKLAKVKQGQCGDPRYLAVIVQAIDKRVKLLGLYPEKQAGETNVNVSVGVAVTSLEQMSDDQLHGYLVEAGRIAGADAPASVEGTDTIDVVPALPPAQATPVPSPPVP